MIERRIPSDSALPAWPEVTRGRTGQLGDTRAGGYAGTVPLLSSASDSLLRVMWRSRWVMLVCVVLALVAGLVYLAVATPVYTSTSKLYLDYGSIRISQPYEPGAVPRTDKYLHTQAELLTSRPILAAAIEPLDGQEQMRTFVDVEIPVAYLHKNIVVSVGKKDEIISVSFDCAYPVEAAEIVNRVVDAYMTSRSEHEQRNSAQVLKILQEEMVRTGLELQERRDSLEDFQANGMPLALGSDQGSGVTQRYLELQDAHTRAQIATMGAASFREGVHALAKEPAALRQYVRAKNHVSAYVGTETERSSLETKLMTLDLQRENVLADVTPDHPTVIAAKAEIERIQTRLAALDDQFVNAALAAAEQQYVEAKDCEEQLVRLFDEQRDKIVKLNAEIAQYRRLQSEVDQLATYSQTLEQQVREMRKVVGEDIGQLRMAILEPALPAKNPSEPQRGRIMAMALMLGLLLGGGIAVARDWLDQTLRSADEISALLSLPVLGVVPAMSRRRRMPERGLEVLLQPDSHGAEAFRTIRTAVFFGAAKDKARTMLIASPVAGDGKSTLVSNLAVAIARTGQKTLIIDADFRKPTQHAIFELDHHERSLSNVFARKIKLGAAIQPTRIERLHLLTCGHGIFNPAEVLNSHQFAGLLKRLAEVYDRILIDAPPVTVVTDAQIIGALCDVTILVLRADKSTRRMTQRAVDALQNVGAHLLGVVVNDVHEAGDRYGYYYGRYRDHYGSDSHNGGRQKSKRPVIGPDREELLVGTAPGEEPASRPIAAHGIKVGTSRRDGR